MIGQAESRQKADRRQAYAEALTSENGVLYFTTTCTYSAESRRWAALVPPSRHANKSGDSAAAILLIAAGAGGARFRGVIPSGANDKWNQPWEQFPLIFGFRQYRSSRDYRKS